MIRRKARDFSVPGVLLRFATPGNKIGRISVGSTGTAYVQRDPEIDMTAFTTSVYFENFEKKRLHCGGNALYLLMFWGEQ